MTEPAGSSFLQRLARLVRPGRPEPAGPSPEEVLRMARGLEARSQAVDGQMRDALALIRITEERSRTIEYQLRDALTLVRITEERSRSIEYQLMQACFLADAQLEMQHKSYVEGAQRLGLTTSIAPVRAARDIVLETEYPLALDSQDHLAPDSTAEGLARPTTFVNHCVDVVGRDQAWLDIGTGSAGLVFEAVMQGVLAFGLDGSDYCRRNRVGYWPLLPHNLRTCDVTRPFRFCRPDGTPMQFGLVSMWEVLEHIAEADLPGVLGNVAAHLAPEGYFIGSISLLEYRTVDGAPYHVTLQNKPWWADMFRNCGLQMVDEHPFQQHLFYRGNGPRFQDRHNYGTEPDAGFHFVARRVR